MYELSFHKYTVAVIASKSTYKQYERPRACDGFVATSGKNTRHLVAAGVHVLKMISYSNEFFIQAVVRKESRVLQVKSIK